MASPDLGAIYAYHTGSSLIDEIEHTFGAGIGGSPVTATRAYDALDRLESIGYTVGGQTAPVTAHAYLYDAASRRTRATREDGAYWQYGYNDRDEVASAVKHLPGGQPLAGWQQGFDYDNIGNRLTATEGGDASGQNRRTVSYTTNRLNQYTGIQRPGKFDVLGVAHPDATVTVNGETATRQSAYWRREVNADTGTGPAWVELDARATRSGVGVNGGDVTAKLGGSQFVDPFWLEPHHDVDGNLLSDGRWAYTWDADNKLLGMRTHPVAVAAGAPEERYEFTYDSSWRRIRTRVWRWDEEKLGDEADTLGAWVLARDERTVYDEWNPVAQIDAAGQVVQRHLWGTDLSGSMQGAGGVGGLLGTWDNGATTRDGSEPGDGVARVWVCAYDGNGNVSAAIAATVAGGGGGGNGGGGAGTVRVARYDYDAFGKTLATWGDGAVAEANRYRFSTKSEDGTGLLYYGYRYYNPEMGKWLSRDPIEERDDKNLYLFAGNSSQVYIANLGNRKQSYRPSPDDVELPALDRSDFSNTAIKAIDWYLGNSPAQVGSHLPNSEVPQTYPDPVFCDDCSTFVSNILNISYAKHFGGHYSFPGNGFAIADKLLSLRSQMSWKIIFYWNDSCLLRYRSGISSRPSIMLDELKKTRRNKVFWGRFKLDGAAYNLYPWATLDGGSSPSYTVSTMANIKKIRFGVGITAFENHTFLVKDGKVLEAHWDATTRSGLYSEVPFDRYLLQQMSTPNYAGPIGMILVPAADWPTIGGKNLEQGLADFSNPKGPDIKLEVPSP